MFKCWVTIVGWNTETVSLATELPFHQSISLRPLSYSLEWESSLRLLDAAVFYNVYADLHVHDKSFVVYTTALYVNINTCKCKIWKQKQKIGSISRKVIMEVFISSSYTSNCLRHCTAWQLFHFYWTHNNKCASTVAQLRWMKMLHFRCSSVIRINMGPGWKTCTHVKYSQNIQHQSCHVQSHANLRRVFLDPPWRKGPLFRGPSGSPPECCWA